MSSLNLYSYDLCRSSTSLDPWPGSVHKSPSHIDTSDIGISTAHVRCGGKSEERERPTAAERTPDRVIRVRRLNSCVASIIGKGKAGTPFSFPTPRSGPASPAYPPSLFELERDRDREREREREREETSLRRVLNQPSAARDAQHSQSLSPRQLKPNLGEQLIYRCQ